MSRTVGDALRPLSRMINSTGEGCMPSGLRDEEIARIRRERVLLRAGEDEGVLTSSCSIGDRHSLSVDVELVRAIGLSHMLSDVVMSYGWKILCCGRLCLERDLLVDSDGGRGASSSTIACSSMVCSETLMGRARERAREDRGS